MKKSINAWSFPQSYTSEDVIDTAKKYGFDAVEFNVELPGCDFLSSFTLDTPDERVAEVGRYAKENGIELIGVSSSMQGVWADTARETVELRERMLRKMLSVATILGTDTILLAPGGMKDGMLLDQSRKNSIASLKSVAPIIRESGIKAGIENIGNFFFMSPYDVVSFLRELDEDVYYSYLDLGNMLAYSKSEYWADVIAPYIVRIHIKDLKRFEYSKYGGVPCDLLRGDWDYKATMRALKQHGFDGHLTAEVKKFNPEQSDDEYFKAVSDAEDVIIDYYNSI